MAAAGPSSSPLDLSDANVVSMDAKDRFAFMLLERIDRLTDELHALTARVSSLDALPENLTAVPGWLENQIAFVVTSPISIYTYAERQDFALRLSQVILDDDDGFDVVNIKPAFGETNKFRCQCFVPTRKQQGATYLVPWLARVSTRLAHSQCSIRGERSQEFGRCILNQGGPEWTFRKGESAS
jgi:hypothetical protein